MAGTERTFRRAAAAALAVSAIVIGVVSWRLAPPLETASAAPKTKTVVFLVGSLASTTAVISGATTTFTFVISLPDMVPDAQPVRSAYISYNAWINNTSGITASVFTLNKQNGTVQSLTGPKLSGGTTEQQLSIRLNATAAMRALVGTASGTYAMTFTANLSGPTRVAEGAELYITYDYDPLAPTQVNTVYNWVYATTSILGTTAVTSNNFNFGLPESGATTTFAVAGSSTNDLWIEYRGFISTSTNLTESFGWNSEATSAVAFTATTQQFSFFVIAPPKTAAVSPNSNNTFKMNSSQVSGLMAPSALAVATYAYNFAGSATLQKTIQVFIAQSTSTNTTAAVNTTTTVAIPETSPSSTNAFLFARLAFATSSSPGVNAFITSGACSVPAVKQFATTTKNTKNTGYLSALWNITPSTTVNAAGNWNVCSSFVPSAVANIPGLTLFLTYNYANNFAAGNNFNTNLSFLAQSNMSPTGTTFAATGVNTSLADSSATAKYSWLDSEFDNNAANTTNQALTLGIGSTNNTYTFPAITASTARRQGATWSVTSSLGFAANITTTVQCSVACINDAAYDAFGITQMIPANFTQAHYHWRLDNNTEASATPAAVQDTATTTKTGTVTRLRVQVGNTGDATSSAAFRLEYQFNSTSGAWTPVATASIGTAAWAMATSSFLTDGQTTTNIASATGGMDDSNLFFVPGEVVATTSRDQTASYMLTGTQFIENEFAIYATGNASTSAPYYFRLSNAGSALSTYPIYPAITVVLPVPAVTSVALNGAGAITLTPNATTTIVAVASTTDPSGPGNIRFATGTIYRTSLGNTCAANNLNCYQIPSSSCSFTSNTSTVSCSAPLWYFAQSTGNGSSSFPTDSWTAAITVTNGNGATATATSTAQNVNVLTAINIPASSISYGTVAPNTDTGSTNQTVTVQNAGNSSSTLQISGTVFVNGASTIPVNYQHYATTSFTFGGAEQQLNGSPTTVPGYVLVGPTSTAAVQGTIYWGDSVPFGSASGTYNATTTFTAAFSS